MCLQNKSFENTMGKGEIARNEQFLLFPQCFLPYWIAFCQFHQISDCCLQTLSGKGLSQKFHASEVSFTTTRNSILSKPLAAFLHNHHQISGQLSETNASCCNDYHRSLERYWPSWGSNQQPRISRSCMLLTELWGSAFSCKKRVKLHSSVSSVQDLKTGDCWFDSLLCQFSF